MFWLIKISTATLLVISVFSIVLLFSIKGGEEKSKSVLGRSEAASYRRLGEDEKVPVLMYHYIRDYQSAKDPVGTDLSVSPRSFESQLDVIKGLGFQTITFEDVKEGRVPQKPIILTFDDGYSDFYTSAWPALKSRNMRAVVYVITEKIGKPGYLKKSEIKELSFAGNEIGSHTISHPDLTILSLQNARNELVQSKKTLEKIIKKEVVSFCYPSGQYNRNIIKLTKAAKYSYAVTIVDRISDFSKPFEISRLRVHPDTDIVELLEGKPSP